jgi:hypothetical protein
MTDKLDFKEWWADFRHEHRNDKDFGYELSCLLADVGSFPQEKREVFIDELLQLEKFELYSCELISRFGSNEQTQLIKNKALNLINQDSTDNVLHDYILFIIRKYNEQDNFILNKYFIDKQIKENIWIPGELFDVNKDLFLKAFAINIEKYPIDKLCDYDGLLYMTHHLDALEYLINNLPFTLSEKLKLFALSKSNHSVSDFDKKLKTRLIELSDIKKSEIELIKQLRLKTINKR